ncbi:MAG TPA: ZIP family metal transporter [Thermoanaerobaculia bacterium]|nr:ZIP family metal transporter [Thermoanaerobaculia bacterium]
MSLADRSAAVRWGMALLPLVALAALLLVIVRLDPAGKLRGDVPPVEILAFERVTLDDGGITVRVLNDGPDAVTIAQVMVDDAYWAFEQSPPGELGHLGAATLRIPYPWVEGETHALRLVSRNGITFDHTIDVAVETPNPGGRLLGIFALIGLYVGVLPVAIGLLWYPLMKRLGRRGLDFVLALTVGLLVFLFVDALHEGSEAAEAVPGSFQGTVLLVFAALAAYLAIDGFGAWLRHRRVGESGDAAADGFGSRAVVALLIAIGIGLHNFGEGLAIGAAFALGELAFGTLLMLGFTLHNTTEGLAIVAPLATEKVALPRLLLLGAIAGVPTIAGAWLGGFLYSPLWAVVFLGVGAGAIAQVVVQITRSMARERGLGELLRSAPVAWGLLAGVVVMYATGTLVG